MTTNKVVGNMVGVVAQMAIFLVMVIASEGMAGTGGLYRFTEKASLSESNVRSLWTIAKESSGRITAAPKPAEPARAQDQGIQWITNFDEALARAKAENKPIFLDFFNPN